MEKPRFNQAAAVLASTAALMGGAAINANAAPDDLTNGTEAIAGLAADCVPEAVSEPAREIGYQGNSLRKFGVLITSEAFNTYTNRTEKELYSADCQAVAPRQIKVRSMIQNNNGKYVASSTWKTLSDKAVTDYNNGEESGAIFTATKYSCRKGKATRGIGAQIQMTAKNPAGGIFDSNTYTYKTKNGAC